MLKYIYARDDMGSIVNKIGKYLKKNIDGAFKVTFSGMTCEVDMRMYYQVKDEPDTFNEMIFHINITSYQNKVRVNITEDTRMEKTIGQLILKQEELHDMGLVMKKVLQALKRAIAKEYADYDFVY